MMLAVAVIWYKYDKAAVYVCHYGFDDSKIGDTSYNGFVSKNTYISGGALYNTDNIRCYKYIDPDTFECPVEFYSYTEFSHYVWITKEQIQKF